MKQLTLSYDRFVDQTVQGINERYQKAELSLFELARFVKNKVKEGIEYGKTKEQVYKDLSKHPDFKLQPHTLKQYGMTASFIEQVGLLGDPDRSIDQSGGPAHQFFSTIQQIAKSSLTLEDKKIILEIANQKNLTKEEVRKKIRLFQNEKRSKTQTVITQKFQNIIEGDCLQHLSNIKNGTVSCLFTDPPYGINFVSNRRIIKDSITRPVENDNKKAFLLLENMLVAIQKKLKKDASIYIFCSWKVVDHFKRIIEKYYTIKNILVWIKNNHGSGDLNNWADKYELCIYATNGNHILIGERPVNILEYTKTNEYHSCEKPVPLLEYILEKSTMEGELIVDPFAGSGSTGVACKNLRRNFLLFEIDPLNIHIIKQRLYE